jgi:hypothetical protein
MNPQQEHLMLPLFSDPRCRLHNCENTKSLNSAFTRLGQCYWSLFWLLSMFCVSMSLDEEIPPVWPSESLDHGLDSFTSLDLAVTLDTRVNLVGDYTASSKYKQTTALYAGPLQPVCDSRYRISISDKLPFFTFEFRP